MTESFVELASDPRQYDGPVGWSHTNNRRPDVQQALLETVLQHAGPVDGARTLDVGSGEGWLCDELAVLGADTTGIEPSSRHVEAASIEFPGLDFKHTDLDGFSTDEEFDLVTGLMVMEHIRDLPRAFAKVKAMLQTAGRAVMLSPAYNDSETSKSGHKLEVQHETEGMVAVRAHKSGRGILYDILRTPERVMQDAMAAGLRMTAYEPIQARDWPGCSDVDPAQVVVQSYRFAHAPALQGE